jgi:hypothetical protein
MRVFDFNIPRTRREAESGDAVFLSLYFQNSNSGGKLCQVFRNYFGNNILAESFPKGHDGGGGLPWKDGKLVSLLDMIKYPINDLIPFIAAIQSARDMAARATDPIEPIPDEKFINSLTMCLDALHKLGAGIDLDTSLLAHLKELHDTGKDRPALVVSTKLECILDGVLENLQHRMFMYVPADQATYWNNSKMFGPEFLVVFPFAAVLELVEAGNCFTAARYTACVFHYMRVAEHGLRILARSVKVKLTDKGRPQPIEYATWDKVIQGIRARIADIRKKPHGPKKEQKLQFYSDAADHCEYMKDIWRNETAHTRRLYKKPETLGVINRVRDFSQLLANHETPKDHQKRLDIIDRRIQEVQRFNASSAESAPQRTESQTGSGEKGESEKAEA